MLCTILCAMNLTPAVATVAYYGSHLTWGAVSSYESAGYNFTDGQVISFEASAYSTLNGTFQISLQKQNFLGFWSDVGYTYTYSCKNGYSIAYGDATGQVLGQWFKTYWAMTGTGTYRFVLKNPSNINEAIIFSNIYWKSNN